MLSSFRLNDCTFGFHPQTQKLKPTCVQHNKKVPKDSTVSSFHLNGHTLRSNARLKG